MQSVKRRTIKAAPPSDKIVAATTKSQKEGFWNKTGIVIPFGDAAMPEFIAAKTARIIDAIFEAATAIIPQIRNIFPRCVYRAIVDS